MHGTYLDEIVFLAGFAIAVIIFLVLAFWDRKRKPNDSDKTKK